MIDYLNVQVSIGKQWKEFLDYNSEPIGFRIHVWYLANYHYGFAFTLNWEMTYLFVDS